MANVTPLYTRLPEDLHAALVEQAKAEKRTITAVVTLALQAYLHPKDQEVAA